MEEKDYTGGASPVFKQLVREEFSKREAPPLAYVHSFGCQQNVNDGEKLLGMLCDMGCGVTRDITAADIIILNTCAVRENAELKVYGNIGELVHLKEKNPNLIIGICGCMAQQKQVVEKIKESYRHVDMAWGTFSHSRLPQLLWETLNGRGFVSDISEEISDCGEDIKPVREVSYKAGVSVMYGCNNFCTYCIVPYVRGRERSRPPKAIIDEIKSLVQEGCREIMLLGQNVNSYGKGLDESIDFPELLRRIDRIEGDFRVRFMSPHPKDAGRELFDVIGGSDKFCKSVHLPLQSGSDRVLKDMNRSYTAERYLEIVDYARSVMPGLSLTTDIMVGFPTETYDDFLKTLEIMRYVKYDNIYSFIYSRRSGTKAALMEDVATAEERGEWFREMLALQRSIADESYKRFLGREFTVLFDGTSRREGFISGKSDEFIITEAKGGSSLIGTMHRVRVTKTMSWAVEGEIID
ncbi:MAG: tRNA (N6-isopentenyl adenosine(37)-C2)-methylthiotransferase MiaB [Oscillospiraceae bacterium]|nr:tRNA (N6-isopentenyl adenosine(37)-C2)-methylthiotransferase MiaB [Oscillospiraceae bacterium]